MTDNAPASRASFRTDIQGMRALAVGVVILAHADLRIFAGGFVGVDVFFVISGFLITTLLYREAAATGRLSLVGFYNRRARRILPAATVVTVATLVMAVVLLPLVRAMEILKDGLFAAFFVANFRFASVGTDYFAQGESASPLQHMWSLSVEEQYYVVWPLLLIGVLAMARLRGRAVRSGAVVAVLGVALVASLVWSVVQTHQEPTLAYFSSLTRAWELAAGSLLAVAMFGRTLTAPRWVLEVGAWLGVAAVVTAVLAFDAGTPFPGYAAVLPIAGTVLLLATGGDGRSTSVARVLSVPPARAMGDWSYSLYLWHWPLLRIAQDRAGAGGLPTTHLVALVVLVFVLSWATYRWVETPFRRSAAPSLRRDRRRAPLPRWMRGVALYPLSIALVAVTFAGGRTYITDALDHGDNPAISTADYADTTLSKDPTVALVEASVLAAEAGAPVPSNLRPSLLGLRQETAPLGACDYRTGTTELCNMGDRTAERSIVIVGDSHARAWSPAISAIGKAHGYATYNLVYSGCPAAQVVQGDPETDRPWEACQEFKQWSLEAIADLHPDLVVVSGSALGPVIDADGTAVGIEQGDRFRELYRAGLDAELASLKPLAGRVVVLGDTPKLPRESGVCLSTRGADLGDCLMQRAPFAHAVQMDFKDVATAQGVSFAGAMKWFCHDQQCPAVVGRTITMRDREHMTPTYAVDLAEPLARTLGIT